MFPRGAVLRLRDIDGALSLGALRLNSLEIPLLSLDGHTGQADSHTKPSFPFSRTWPHASCPVTFLLVLALQRHHHSPPDHSLQNLLWTTTLSGCYCVWQG